MAKEREPSLLEYIPKGLRQPLENPKEIGQMVIGNELAAGRMTISEAVGFFEGFLAHQENLSRIDANGKNAGKPETKTFPVYLEEFDSFERNPKGKKSVVIGTKYQLKYSADNSDKIESIDTSWTEFNGFDKSRYLFDIALSNSIVEDLKDIEVGQEIFIRKAFVYTEALEMGNRVRYLADAWPAATKSQTSRGPAKRRSTKEDSHTSSANLYSIIDSMFIIAEDEDEQLEIMGDIADEIEKQLDVIIDDDILCKMDSIAVGATNRRSAVDALEKFLKKKI